MSSINHIIVISEKNLNRHSTYKYSLIAFLAVAGLVGSLTHYHSEGLECLHHAEEEHYAQNDNFCPICTLVVSEDFTSNLHSEIILPSKTLQFVFIDLNISSISKFFELGRAPPTIA